MAAATRASAAQAAAGPAHVATVSFVASRAVPTGGFVVALAGGTALARVGQRLGTRRAYGAALAAVIETVAIMGPARFGVPLTQAISAPPLGAMHERGRSFGAQLALAFLVRVLSNAAGTAVFIFVITGGLDAYAGAYDNVAGKLGVHLGVAGTLAVTAAGLLGWGLLASVAQVAVYRRGLDRWNDDADPGEAPPAPAPVALRSGRFDPRLAVVAAAVCFALLLWSTAWPVLAGVAGFLVLATLAARGDSQPWRTGFVLAAVVALGAASFSLVGGLGAEIAGRRALRAILLVLTATWLRSAAGAEGLRDVARRVLGRFRWVPTVTESLDVLAVIGSEGRLAAAGQSLAHEMRRTPRRAVPMTDAVLGWVSAEAARYRAAGARPDTSKL